MRRDRFQPILFSIFALALLIISKNAARAQMDPTDIAPTVKKVVNAAGGEDKLLKVFRIKEKLVLNPDGKNKGSDRVSILVPPEQWWIGKTERVKQEKEPATFLVWAWTLGAITDPKSKLSPLPEINDQEVTLFGLRISGTINPPMDMYFDKKESKLARIDWRNDVHRFSEWRSLDGLQYPSRTIGYKKSGKAWYQSDITELTRLTELPKGLSK